MFGSPISRPTASPPCQVCLSRPTVGFSGSGGAGKTPSPENYFAGSRRIPSSGEAAVRLEPVLGGVLASVN
jgi:hypothetical protein